MSSAATLAGSEEVQGTAERQSLEILVLFALAYLVRLAGVSWGLPLLFHPDEPFIADHAMEIVRTGDPNPHWFLYPDLWIYVHVAIVKLAGAISGLCEGFYAEGRCLQASPGLATVYLIGRSLTALLGTLTVLLIYRTGKQLWGHRAGMVAAAWVAFSPDHVRHCQFITTDGATGFLAALVLWLAVDGRMRLSGAMAGLAAATKYNAGLAVVIPLAFALHRRLGWRAMGGILIPCGVTFLTAMPWIILDTASVLAGLREQATHYAAGHFGADGDPFTFYILHFFHDAPGLFLAALAGWVGLLRHDRRLALTLLAFPIAYQLLFCTVRITVARNMMPVLPLLSLGAGYAWVLLRRAPIATNRGALLVAALLVPPLHSIAIRTLALHTPDPREVSRRWMTEHLDPEARIVCEFYGPPLQAPRFRAVTISSLSRFPLEEYTKNEVDYLVASAGTYERFLTDPEREPGVTRFYRRLFAEWTEIERFEPVPGYGPVVRIFERPDRITKAGGSSPGSPDR